jgi:hypothetical protein
VTPGVAVVPGDRPERGRVVAATTTTTGLKVYAQLDERDYSKGPELAAVNLTRDPCHGEWNYRVGTIRNQVVSSICVSSPRTARELPGEICRARFRFFPPRPAVGACACDQLANAGLAGAHGVNSLCERAQVGRVVDRHARRAELLGELRRSLDVLFGMHG